jgi:hypothetical protein
MRKRGSIFRKWRPCLPKGTTVPAYHCDRSDAAALFANGTNFVDKPRIKGKLVPVVNLSTSA